MQNVHAKQNHQTLEKTLNFNNFLQKLGIQYCFIMAN